MANDRMYLECPEDNRRFLLAKCLGNGWYTNTKTGLLMQNQLLAFFEEHQLCTPFVRESASTRFKLVYESEEKDG